MRRRFLLAVGALVVVLVAGATGAWLVLEPSEPSGSIDTDLEGVTTLVPKQAEKRKPRKPRRPAVRHEEPCWEEFGGDPQRSLSRVRIHLGKPTRALWARAVGSYMEYPPSYCDGTLYVNTFRGRTAAFDARTGKLRWSRKHRGAKHSTPAIAGPRLIISSKSGSVTALDRETGRPALAVAHVGEDRVVAGRDREHGLLRGDRWKAVRREHAHRSGAVGVRHRRANQCEPVDLGRSHLHLHVCGLAVLPRSP